ncbi:hypothetical protein XANCAGTX0491_006508 [Xanthoria calcicola]
MSDTPGTPMTEQSKNLTPPCTPPPYHLRKAPMEQLVHRAIPSISNPAGDNAQGIYETTVTPTAEESPSWEMISPRPYTGTYRSPSHEELGHGAWSTVYRAIETPETPPSTMPTPPSSPAGLPGKSAIGRVLAIKTPARNDAHDIIYHEARVLTYLHSSRRASDYLVPFHGYDATSKSLVMDAVPLNLEMHAKCGLKNARANFSTRTMFDPVCGSQEWQSLATQLIAGLDFLHSNRCIHGDIKPSNILLCPDEDGPSKTYTPLYCDFSSSRIVTDDSNVSDSEPAPQITALTPDYASPELLTSLRSAGAVATTAADVYALAVTLVVAAIGESPYAGAGMEVLKLSMAREGKVLEFARQADQGTRVMKGKMVERCLKGALEKNVGERSTAKEWKDNVRTIFEG